MWFSFKILALHCMYCNNYCVQFSLKIILCIFRFVWQCLRVYLCLAYHIFFHIIIFCVYNEMVRYNLVKSLAYNYKEKETERVLVKTSSIKY